MLSIMIAGAAALVGVYFGYPALLLGWRYIAGDGRRSAGEVPASVELDDPPTVSVLISAYNEEDVIEAKLENVLGVGYPDSRLEVIVLSDASDDDTDEIVRTFADTRDSRVSLLRIEGRRGKTACQNEGVARASGDVVVFTDADSDLTRNALRALVRALLSADVGCASGDLTYADEEETGEGVYWRYERWVKTLESETGGLVGANGTLYALRRKDYVPLPEYAISDFLEPLAIASSGGGNTAFVGQARAVEPSEPSVWDEARRRIRIVRRTAYNLARTMGENRGRIPLHRRPDLLVKIAAHKVVRWFSLLFVAMFLVGSLGAESQTANLAGAAAALGALVSGLVIAVEQTFDRSFPGLLKAPAYFLISGYSMLAGVTLALLRGGQSVWDTAGRRQKP